MLKKSCWSTVLPNKESSSFPDIAKEPLRSEVKWTSYWYRNYSWYISRVYTFAEMLSQIYSRDPRPVELIYYCQLAHSFSSLAYCSLPIAFQIIMPLDLVAACTSMWIYMYIADTRFFLFVKHTVKFPSLNENTTVKHWMVKQWMYM